MLFHPRVRRRSRKGAIALPATPIFVLGSPRSGTTAIGALIGTIPGVFDAGEYGGFYLASVVAPQFLTDRMKSSARHEYLSSLFNHASTFIAQQAKAKGCSYFVDATPGNLLAANVLAINIREALFVLTLRHYSGVILSLARSFDSGVKWAGATWRERARLWSTFYASASLLPKDRTLVVSYERLCCDPSDTVHDLLDGLAKRLSVPAFKANIAVLARSHATMPAEERATVVKRHGSGWAFCSRSPLDSVLWTKDINRRVRPEVKRVDSSMRELFRDVYISPLKQNP
jgi:hypothetical protein